MHAGTQPPPAPLHHHHHLQHPSVDDFSFRSSGKASSHCAHNDIVVLASLRKCLPSLPNLSCRPQTSTLRGKSNRMALRTLSLRSSIAECLSNERVALQGHAVITMAGSVCNLEQRIFESSVSYTPGFAMPCLTGCSVGFMSLLLVQFQSMLGP